MWAEGGAVRKLAPAQRQEGPSDPDLVHAARAGDHGAFHAIFRRHAPAVRRFLFSVLRDAHAADESTQETFIRAHSRLDALLDPQRLRPWLLGIARILALDERTLRQRDACREELDAAAAGVIELDPTPEARLLDREADAVLAAEIAQLPPARRAALVLRVDQELGYLEIAGLMGWPLQKVKNEIHRGRLQIRARVLSYLRGRR
jgi:RNA polymerase sigma-70 factor (ECF subfamily)